MVMQAERLCISGTEEPTMQTPTTPIHKDRIVDADANKRRVRCKRMSAITRQQAQQAQHSRRRLMQLPHEALISCTDELNAMIDARPDMTMDTESVELTKSAVASLATLASVCIRDTGHHGRISWKPLARFGQLSKTLVAIVRTAAIAKPTDREFMRGEFVDAISRMEGKVLLQCSLAMIMHKST